MLEIIHPSSAAHVRIVLFDFDGTISLVRSGWMQVMVPMMIEVLNELGTGETNEQLRQVVEGFVWRLTGKETLYQMIALAGEVTLRGGTPLDPLVYKKRYLDRLWEVIRDRVEGLRSGACPPDRYLVPGSRGLLESLKARGLSLYLASGTDDIYMQEEARLLDVTRYFDGGVYGSPGDDADFSKRGVIEQVVARGEAQGPEMISFGDGHVELEAVKDVAGVAVGLATLEPECDRIDEWKRERLIASGADYIIPNFLCWNELKELLFAE